MKKNMMVESIKEAKKGVAVAKRSEIKIFR